MPYASLRDFIDRLEKSGRLVRVKAPVSPVLEMTEIQTRLLAEQGPAVLFENVVGSDMPVLVNLFGTVERVAWGLGVRPAGLPGLGELLAELREPRPPQGLADALTSVLAIAALLAGRYLGWIWMDPVMGIVGAVVIARWSWTLMRDTASVLLDATDNHVADEVRELVREGMHCTQIALLYRSNAQSRVLEHQLIKYEVSYRIYGGTRFFDRQEVKHALAYLRLIANPDDDTAFARVVNFPTRGIGSRSVEALQEAAHRANSSLYNAAASLSGKAGASVGNFIRLIESMRNETQGLPLPEVIDHLIEKSGLRQHYLGEKEGGERLENLDELINAATSFVQEESDTLANPVDADPLASFLAHASLEAGEHQAGEGQEAVQLMTVHAAKGLEFDVVFITGLEHGLFPHDNSTQERDGVEEERRLMYVAVTRARKRLYLTHAQTRMLHGQTRYCVPSMFLEELPEDLLRKVGNVPSYAAKVPSGYSSGGTATKLSASEPATVGGFRIGQNVQHAKFGLGVIVSAEGRGADARVEVNFGTHGMKWLALEYAKLTHC